VHLDIFYSKDDISSYYLRVVIVEEDVEGEAKGEDEERVPGQEQEEGVQHSGTRGFIWNFPGFPLESAYPFYI
jgi:hypothetical protein